MEGTQVKREVVDEEEPLIKLGLAVGGGGGGGEGKRRSEFTAAQVEELEQQRLIYKYLAAGLPPPFHLVLPVWKSVAATVSNAVFYQQYPSFLRYGSVDYGLSKMDPESGRCRRTDGKKWRCSRDVFPNERYCEKHRHRGRQRSRKPVESCEVTSLPSTELVKISDGELANSQKKLQSQTAKGLQLMAQSSNNGSSTSHTGCHELPENIVTVANIPNMSYRAAFTPVAAAPSPTAGRMTATTSACIDNNIWINVKDYGYNYAKNIGIIRGSRNNINAGFSPKSVLQAEHMIPVNCNGLYIDNRSSEELEPGRCRRTDGKKWRCKKNVIPDQKYCDRHIHRGVKQMKTSGPVATASTLATAMNATRPSQIMRIAGEILNTNLTMSILARSPLMQNDEKSNSSSDSDATITDTSLAAYKQLT